MAKLWAGWGSPQGLVLPRSRQGLSAALCCSGTEGCVAAGCNLELSCPCAHLLQQLCQMLSVRGHFLVQVLDGLLGSAKLLQTLLLTGLGGSQLLLQPSQAVLQALGLLLLCPQL